MIEFILGLSLGLVSSLHCVGMCGPLILAIPKNNSNLGKLSNNLKYKSFLNPLLYNLGRISSYIFIGTMLGFFGEILRFAFIQEQLSIFTGVFMLVGGIVTKFDITNSFQSITFKKLMNKFKSNIAQLLHSQSYIKMLLLGALNGFLPCGMVYMALISSLALGSIESSAIYITGFGIGTSPLLISLFLFSNWIPTTIRQKMNKYTPILTILIGFVVVLRGMSLGIPYISPVLDKYKSQKSEKLNTKKALDKSVGGHCNY